MKFNKIRLVGPTNVDLPVGSGIVPGPYLLKGADGLDAPEVDVFITQSLNQGGVYQGRRPQGREVVLLVGLLPEWNVGQTAEELRTTLYGLLTPRSGSFMQIQIMLDETVVAYADGQIKKMVAPIFSQDPEVQITIGCVHPQFFAPSPKVLSPYKSTLNGFSSFTITNEGTAPAGFTLSFTLNAGHSGTLQILENVSFGRYMSLDGTFAVGDRIVIDTRPGSRRITKTTSAGVSKNIIDWLSPGSPWLDLYAGDNKLKINNDDISWYLSGFVYTPAYWGV